MPNLPLHIMTSYRVSQLLGEEFVTEENLGFCLLGSTVPDIRAMTKNPRSKTHFTELSVIDIGEGVSQMLNDYPQIRIECQESPKMKAFICGYISHLICDETWITQIYRPVFSEEFRQCSEIESNMWDRALQLELDSISLTEIKSNALIDLLPDDITGINLEFVDSEDLKTWTSWVVDLVNRDFSWDRLHNAMNSMYRNDSDVQHSVSDFIGDIHNNLTSVHRLFTGDILDWYLSNTVNQSVSVIKESLIEN